MPYKFPNVSFDWLGELPQLSEDARGRSSRKEALADLDFSSAESMEKSAQKLFATNNTQNIEIALRLQGQAREKKALGHRISEDLQYRQNIPAIMRALEGGGGAPASMPEPAAPQAPPDFNWNAPSGAIPGVSQAPPSQAPIPPNMAQSPSEELLARAEGLSIPAARGPQFAQAGGVPMPQGPQAPPALPPWAQGAQMPAATRPPVQVPGAPPQMPLQQSGAPDAALQEAQRLRGALMLAPPKMPQGALQALMTQYRNALDKTRLPDEVKTYEFEQAQRQLQGESRMTIEAWRARKDTRGEITKEVIDQYKEYRKDAKTQGEALRTINRMEQVMDHPEFVSGRGTALYATGISAFNTLAQIAKGYGITVPEGIQKRIDAIADPQLRTAALAEEFTALSNRLVKESLGTLGNQISEGDRTFVERSFPNLSNTPQGNRALLKYMRAVAEQTGKNEEWAREYRRNAKERANAPDMEEYIARKREESALFVKRDGSLTKLGEQFQADVQKHSAPTQVPPPSRAQAPARTRRVQGPDGKFYKFDTTTGAMEPE